MNERNERNPFRINGQPNFAGDPAWRQWVEVTVEKIFSLDRLNTIYGRFPTGLTVDQFLDQVIRELRLNYRVALGEPSNIPAQGRLIIVANHPFGALEGIVLGHLIRKIRPDVRFVANYLLNRVPELSELFFQVDPFGGMGAHSRSFAGIRQAREWLEKEGCLVLFPAGEVSHLNLRDGLVSDPPWNLGAARLARASLAPVLPIYFHGTNSAMFHLAGLIEPRLRTALLPRELIKKADRTISLAVGDCVGGKKIEQIADDGALTDFLRAQTYFLGRRLAAGKQTKMAKPRLLSPRAAAPIPPPRDKTQVAAEVAGLSTQHLMLQDGAFDVYVAQAGAIPVVMQELGRLREVTFRAAGEGTLRERDIDLFDAYYDHIFIWDRKQQELVGAYRVARTDDVVRRYKIRGLYTQTLFHYGEPFLEQLGPAIELGRSFVRSEYQKSYAPLLLLWKGIGRYLCVHNHYKTLFGPVSISQSYAPLSQALMVEFLNNHHPYPVAPNAVKGRRPYRAATHPRAQIEPRIARYLDSDELGAMVSSIEPDGKGVPVLLRHYLNLGGEIAAFNVDKRFNNCLDALLIVDVTKAPLNALRRYMGKDAADLFLAGHREDAGITLAS